MTTLNETELALQSCQGNLSKCEEQLINKTIPINILLTEYKIAPWDVTVQNFIINLLLISFVITIPIGFSLMKVKISLDKTISIIVGALIMILITALILFIIIPNVY